MCFPSVKKTRHVDLERACQDQPRDHRWSEFKQATKGQLELFRQALGPPPTMSMRDTGREQVCVSSAFQTMREETKSMQTLALSTPPRGSRPSCISALPCRVYHPTVRWPTVFLSCTRPRRLSDSQSIENDVPGPAPPSRCNGARVGPSTGPSCRPHVPVYH